MTTYGLTCQTCGKVSMKAIEEMPLTSAKYRLMTLPQDQLCYGHPSAPDEPTEGR